jgi:choline-sulfatase
LKPKRILYLDIDSLRPDHLGCYGYGRCTSPHIDRVAKEGVRLEQVFVSDAPCLPSRTALYSGRFGFQTGVVGHGGTAAEPRPEGPDREFQDRLDRESLPAVLQAAGWHTAVISSFGQRHSARHFYSGFREIHNPGFNGTESGEQIQPILRDWLEKNGRQDGWYLHVNYWDPHTPYRAPAELGEPFAKDSLPSWITDEVLQRHIAMPGPHTAQDLNMYDEATDPKYPRMSGAIRSRADLRKVIDGYDLGVFQADRMIGEIFQFLDREKLWEETAVLVSADHGENLGELGLYAEHATADVPTCRIPWILKWPGMARGEVRKGLHYHLDWALTLTELLGLKAPPSWDGKSFSAALKSGAKDAGREELVIGQGAHVCQRSVRWDRYLYIRTWHCGFHLFPREMVFDVETDPHEQNDLAAARPDLVKEGRRKREAWEKAQQARGAKDPLETVLAEGGPWHARKEHLSFYLPRLVATGREPGATELRKKYLS